MKQTFWDAVFSKYRFYDCYLDNGVASMDTVL